MTDSLIQNKPDISTYKHYRSVTMELVTKIFDSQIDRQFISRAAESLSMLSRKKAFDESNMDILMEYCLYEVTKLGKTLVKHYFDAFVSLNETENEMLTVMANASSGLFKIVKTIPEDHLVEIQELTDNKRTLIIIDTGMSESIEPNSIVFMRPLEASCITMSTGVCFVFPSEMKEQLMQRWKRLKPKERFSSFYRLNKIKGIRMVGRDIV